MLIKGILYSKTNNRIPRTAISKTGKRYSKWIKDSKTQKSFSDMVLQLKAQWQGRNPIPEPAELVCYIYYPSRRHDLDVELLKDALQAAGIVKNDRHIFRETATKIIDPAYPRMEVTVRPMQEEITG